MELLIQIQNLREKLNQMVADSPSLTKDEILVVSKELDGLIECYHQQQIYDDVVTIHKVEQL